MVWEFGAKPVSRPAKVAEQSIGVVASALSGYNYEFLMSAM